MKYTRKEYDQQRKELLDVLYIMVDELEHNPSLRRRRAGFPFDVLASGIHQVFSGLEGAVKRWVMPSIERWLEGLRRRWERLRG